MTAYQKQQVRETIKRVLRAIIYCRVSTDKQEQEGESLEYQEAKCRQYAEFHNIDVLLVLHEAKSGFIHYSLREKLTLARQMICDGMANMIIVWDLRRFSRNFVHSAMIFEEIEGAGGEIVSVSENIDNSLTGKLIRSILAWSAESEREKILEYANRRWQTRLELGLPVGTGFAPYGWEWKNEEKISYVINKEEAAVRISVFHMFVEEDMSLRSIAHKLSADKIPTATQKRYPNRGGMHEVAGEAAQVPHDNHKKRGQVWTNATLFDILKDKENIGILTVCKQKNVLGEDGKLKRIPHPDRREIPGGIPAIIPIHLYERAQRKLAANRETKSHLPRNPQAFLIRGHLYCATCKYKMQPRMHRKTDVPYYYCNKFFHNQNKCPDMPSIKADDIDKTVWDDCCVLFERIDIIQAKIEQEIERSISTLLEDSKGRDAMTELKAAIDFAKQELNRHLAGSYYYNLISQDIQAKEDQLQRFEKEYKGAADISTATNKYKERILGLLEFVNVMRGKYHCATFQEKRNALEVLGVKVYIHSLTGRNKRIEVTYSPLFTGVNTSQEVL